jgi:hypothetical protein
LKRRLAERTAGNGNGGQQAARLIIESSENTWAALFNSSSWFVVMRRVVPLAYFLVVAASFYVLLQQASRRGEFVWGSTSCWVVFIEMVPALALGVTSICGLFEGTFFPREVQYFFKTGLLVPELVSTILVARYWNAQAEAAKVGFERARAVDPQQSRKSVVFTVAALGLGAAEMFSRESINWNYLTLVGLLATIACALVFTHATFKMLGAARAPDSARRISAYITASVLCMVAQVFNMIAISTAAPMSPNQMFIFVSVLHLARAGTGLCQLFVFFPHTPASKPAAVGQIHPSTDATEAIGSPDSISIETRLLTGESAIVRALTENNGRLEQENVRLL